MIPEILFTCSLASGDILLTRSVINRGGMELNPLLGQSLTRQVAIKSTFCLGQGLILSKLPKKRKKVGYIIIGTIGLGLIGNGIVQGRK